jgi:hypothetical protein
MGRRVDGECSALGMLRGASAHRNRQVRPEPFSLVVTSATNLLLSSPRVVLVCSFAEL